MNRRTFVLVAAACAAIALAGCETSPRRVVVKGGDVTLASMVDQRVEFTAELQGPAKLGDFLTVSGEQIYLDELSGAGQYGRRVTVAGTLRRFTPPTVEDCADGCEHAEVPAHYWIENGQFVAPSPGTQ